MSEVKTIWNAHCFNAIPPHSMKKNTTSSSKKTSLKVFTFHNFDCRTHKSFASRTTLRLEYCEKDNV